MGVRALTFIGVFASIIASLRNRKSIHEVHLSLNGRLNELIEAKMTIAKAEGKVEALENK